MNDHKKNIIIDLAILVFIISFGIALRLSDYSNAYYNYANNCDACMSYPNRWIPFAFLGLSVGIAISSINLFRDIVFDRNGGKKK